MSQLEHPWLSTYQALGKDWHTIPEVPPLTFAIPLTSVGKMDKKALRGRA